MARANLVEDIEALKKDKEEMRKIIMELEQRLLVAEAIIKWCITKLCKTEASLGEVRRGITKSIVQMNGFSFTDVISFIDPLLKKIFVGKEKEE